MEIDPTDDPSFVFAPLKVRLARWFLRTDRTMKAIVTMKTTTPIMYKIIVLLMASKPARLLGHSTCSLLLFYQDRHARNKFSLGLPVLSAVVKHKLLARYDSEGFNLLFEVFQGGSTTVLLDHDICVGHRYCGQIKPRPAVGALFLAMRDQYGATAQQVYIVFLIVGNHQLGITGSC